MEPGRRGTGVYFWRESTYSTYLSISWWEFRTRGKGNQCAVIHVVISVRDEEYFDTDDFSFKEAVIKVGSEKFGFDRLSNKELAGLYDLFISELEKANGVIYKVLEARVPLPPLEYCEKYPIKIIGVPHIYVVRHANCLTIEKVQEPDNEKK